MLRKMMFQTSVAFISFFFLIQVEAFKFLSIGDWGDDSTFVGSGLSKFFAEEAEDAPLALLLGDNFYESGVKCQCIKMIDCASSPHAGAETN
jgi:hypothetical protein